MKKEMEFTPELGLFIFIVGVMVLLSIGVLYYGYIRLRGMTITSWWRSSKNNWDVGGVRNSLHLIGLAWDVVPVTEENIKILQTAGLRVIDEGDHLHAQII